MSRIHQMFTRVQNQTADRSGYARSVSALPRSTSPRAAFWLRPAIRKLPVQKNAALAAARKRRAEMLIEEARKRVERNPTDLQFRFELGEHLMNVGHFRELAGVAACPQNPNARLKAMNALGRCYRESGMFDLAARNWKKPRARSQRWTQQRRKSFTILDWFTSGWATARSHLPHEANLRGGLRLQRRGNASGKFLRGRELIQQSDCNYDQLPRGCESGFPDF